MKAEKKVVREGLTGLRAKIPFPVKRNLEKFHFLDVPYTRAFSCSLCRVTGMGQVDGRSDGRSLGGTGEPITAQAPQAPPGGS